MRVRSRQLLRPLTKWASSLVALAALTLLLLNACGLVLAYFVEHDSVMSYAGMVTYGRSIPDTFPFAPKVVFNNPPRHPQLRMQWLDPVWRTKSWSWWPSHARSVWLGMGGSGESDEVQCPLWFLALPSLALATSLWLSDLRRRHRRGHCPHCNYLLTGLPRSPTHPLLCPECGRPAPPAPHFPITSPKLPNR